MATEQHTTTTLTPFTFHHHTLSVITDDQGEPWWIASEVCVALEGTAGLHQRLQKLYFLPFDMLAIASSLDDNKLGFEFLVWISKCMAALDLDSPSFWEMYGCVATHIVWEQQCKKKIPDEFYWHKIFKKHVGMLIPGGAIIKRRQKDINYKNGIGYPDFLVKVENDICPVEIKRGDFNHAAYRQLRNYISGYKAAYGFAVAQKVTVPLDDNMIFVSLEGLEL